MDYRRLGRSGLKLSALSFGAWVTFHNQLDEDAAAECMTLAYESGVNFFDNAEVYADGRAEELMGAVLARAGWPRDSFCVSSKVYWGGELPTQRGLHRKHVVDACASALRRLRVEYLDLYYCHRPDLETPIEETVRAMDGLVRRGLVLYWGTSEWSAQQIQEAHGVARELGLTPPTMEQPQYNLLHRDRVEREYHRLYDGIGLGTTTWSPLASGILTGKYANGIPPGSRMALDEYQWLRQRLETAEGRTNLERSRRLEPIARELGISLAQLSIAWCLKNPHVSSVILGASRAAQLRENLAAVSAVGLLEPPIMERIEAIVQNRPVLPTQF
jgi:voltage-dependent potassium channel beta subunit